MYWVRIFDLPIANKKDALKVIPGLFEDFIDITEKKFYLKQLSSNRYLAFAYDEKLILEALEKTHIEVKNVKKISFAQIELLDKIATFETPYVKVDGIAFSFSNEILVKIPENLPITIVNNIDIDTLKLSNESVTISSYSQYIENTTAKTLSFIIAILTVFFLLKIVTNFAILEKYEHRLAQLEMKNSKQFSTIQLKSITQKYEKNFEMQMEIRKLFAFVLDMDQALQIQILSFEFKNKKVLLKIAQKRHYTQQTVQKIQQYLEKKYKNSRVNSGTNFIRIEVRL